MNEPAPLTTPRDLSHQRLEVLYEVARALPALLDAKELVGRILDLALETTGAERGVLFLRNSDGAVEPEIARGADDATLERAAGVSRRILEHALLAGEALLSDDARADERFATQSVMLHNIVSFMCVPLLRGDQILGALYVDHRTFADLFTREDLAFLRALADLCAVALENARRHAGLEGEVRRLRRDVEGKYRFGSLLGGSESMVRLVRVLERVIDSEATVLLCGENGTGKELVARALHQASRRAARPFVVIDCGALPESLATSELFGHRRGAFTGARDDHAGLFEQAEGGTVFLDQVEDLPTPLQPHLLRLLQEGEVRRVGETAYRRVHVRVVAASRVDLAQRVRDGSFREDLYYRLRVVPVDLPPLRERREDIPALAAHFLERARARNGASGLGFSRACMEAMLAHSWPGNVRELEHAIERATLLACGDRIEAADMGIDDVAGSRTPAPGGVGPTDRETRVGDALRRHQGNVSRAAEELGVSRRAIQKFLAKRGLRRESFRSELPGDPSNS